jgi:hypothetical protein
MQTGQVRWTECSAETAEPYLMNGVNRDSAFR